MQQRYYDPQIGRFLSVDPIDSSFNRYSYAANNPYGFVDPDGRQSARAAAKDERDAKGNEVWGATRMYVGNGQAAATSQPTQSCPIPAASSSGPLAAGYRGASIQPEPAEKKRSGKNAGPSVRGFLAERISHEVIGVAALGPGVKATGSGNLAETDSSGNAAFVVGEGWFVGGGGRFRVYDGGQQPGLGFSSVGLRIGAGLSFGGELSWDAGGHFNLDVSGGWGIGEGIIYQPPVTIGLSTGNLDQR